MPQTDPSPKDRPPPDATRGEVVFLSVLDLRRDWLRTEVLRAALGLCGRARWRLIRTVRDLVSSTGAPAEVVEYELDRALAMLDRCQAALEVIRSRPAGPAPRRGIESEAHLDHACFRVIARVRHATESDLRARVFVAAVRAGLSGPEAEAEARLALDWLRVRRRQVEEIWAPPAQPIPATS